MLSYSIEKIFSGHTAPWQSSAHPASCSWDTVSGEQMLNCAVCACEKVFIQLLSIRKNYLSEISVYNCVIKETVLFEACRSLQQILKVY